MNANLPPADRRGKWARWAMLGVLATLCVVMVGCGRRRVYRSTGTVAVYSAPPPPPAQVVVQRPVAPYANAVWVEGHWEWSGGQYVWTPGYYVQARAGYSFQQPRWVRQGGRHVYVRGGWSRGGTVVHHVRPAPRRSNIYVRPGGSVRVSGPRGGVQVRSRGPVYRGGGGSVRVQGRRGGSVTVRRRAPQRYRGRGGTVRATSPRGRVGGSVTVRPR